MAISKKIAQLTALALKDKVLTFVERQTIVKSAMLEGVPEDEINDYLNKALEERMKAYSKDELTHCPCCGAQVPLISDECFYCGASLKSSEPSTSNEVNIAGEEADIIRQENKNTAEERRNIRNCPDCGAAFPLISNVCPSCGHILREQTDSDLNIRKLIDNINGSIKVLKETPKPTFIDVLKFQKHVVLFVLAALFLIVTFSLMGYANWSGLFAIVSIVLLVRAFKQFKKMTDVNSPAKKADDTFYTALYNLEMYQRQVSTLYGDNAEAKAVLGQFGSLVADLKKARNRSRNTLTIIMIAITIVTLILPVFAPTPIENYQRNRENNPQVYEISEMRSTLEPFPFLSVNDRYVPYFSVDGKATLSIDVLNQHQTYINKSMYDTIYYKLRISGIKMDSKGVAMERPDTVAPILYLWDKNENNEKHVLVGKKLGPFQIETVDGKGSKDNLQSFLKNGAGSYYADFVSHDSTTDYQTLKNIIDSACYYTIY